MSGRMKLSVCLILFCFARPVLAAAPMLDKVDLFEAEKGGYALFRIPGIVITAKGTMIAYCEARLDTKDWGQIDVMMRRSRDGGKTWEQPRALVKVHGGFERNPAAVEKKLGKDGAVTVNNPVMIASKDGTVHCLYCVEYMRCFYMKSGDDGATWSAPVEITSAFEGLRPAYPWRVLATGPGHGIELRNGRLLVAVWLSRGTGGGAHRPSAVSTIYSDDAGKSWKAGEIVANETDPLTNPNETVAVELADGRVMLNIRSESPENRRAISISPDGAKSWSRPVFDQKLLEPICMASIIRLSTQSDGDKNRIVFANPDNLEKAGATPKAGQSRDRKNVSIKLSYDEGKTWPVNKVLDPGVSGYSDLAVGKDGTIYCLYERGSGDKTPYRTQFLTLARFNLEWLTDGKDSLAR